MSSSLNIGLVPGLRACQRRLPTGRSLPGCWTATTTACAGDNSLWHDDRIVDCGAVLRTDALSHPAVLRPVSRPLFSSLWTGRNLEAVGGVAASTLINPPTDTAGESHISTYAGPSLDAHSRRWAGCPSARALRAWSLSCGLIRAGALRAGSLPRVAGGPASPHWTPESLAPRKSAPR